MNLRILNRNYLKIIALITMLVDHIGIVFFPDIVLFRIIGRISFPIFAFFVAEGYFYTRNKKKYYLQILLFALISQVPYVLIFKTLRLNILFTFFIALSFIKIFQTLSKVKKVDKIFLIGFVVLISVLCILIDPYNIINYGIYGICLVLNFYYLKNNNILKFFNFTLLTILYMIENLWISKTFVFSNSIQIFALLAIPILLMFNNQKGKLNLKWLFYVFYPLHLFVLYIIAIFV